MTWIITNVLFISLLYQLIFFSSLFSKHNLTKVALIYSRHAFENKLNRYVLNANYSHWQMQFKPSVKLTTLSFDSGSFVIKITGGVMWQLSYDKEPFKTMNWSHRKFHERVKEWYIKIETNLNYFNWLRLINVHNKND